MSISSSVGNSLTGLTGLFSKKNQYEPTREHWVPDEAASHCMLLGCEKKFDSFLERKHHCRRCGNIFCQVHCSRVRRLDQFAQPNPNVGVEAKVCDRCYLEGRVQEPGQTRDWSKFFLQKRDTSVKNRKVRQGELNHTILLLSVLSAKEINQQQPFKVWVNDKSRSSCPLCKKKFTLLMRRHHCRLCGGVFCDACTSERLEIPLSAGAEVGHLRVCGACLALERQREREKDLRESLKSAEEHPLFSINRDLSKHRLVIADRISVFRLCLSELRGMQGSKSPEEKALFKRTCEDAEAVDKSLADLLGEYEKAVRRLMATPCSTQRQQRVKDNMKSAYVGQLQETVSVFRAYQKQLKIITKKEAVKDASEKLDQIENMASRQSGGSMSFSEFFAPAPEPGREAGAPSAGVRPWSAPPGGGEAPRPVPVAAPPPRRPYQERKDDLDTWTNYYILAYRLYVETWKFAIFQGALAAAFGAALEDLGGILKPLAADADVVWDEHKLYIEEFVHNWESQPAPHNENLIGVNPQVRSSGKSALQGCFEQLNMIAAMVGSQATKGGGRAPVAKRFETVLMGLIEKVISAIETTV